MKITSCIRNFAYEKKSFFIASLRELKSFVKQIIPFLSKGSFLCLSGTLGVGKTTFVQLLCSELDVEERVTSPTFTMLKRYWSKEKNCFINHFDFFRVLSGDDIEAFCDLREEAINIIEWPEKAPLFSSSGRVIKVKIFFHHDGRRIEVYGIF